MAVLGQAVLGPCQGRFPGLELLDMSLRERVRRLVETNSDGEFTLAHRGWPESTLARVPSAVHIERLDAVDRQ